MSSIYVQSDGRLSLHIAATWESVQQHHKGTRSLIHLPVDWPDLLTPSLAQLGPDETFEPRAPRPGDQIGLAFNLPRVHMADIEQVKQICVHDTSPDDLVLLGRTKGGLDGYRKSWDECWPEYPWESKPEVYAIYWKPLVDPHEEANRQKFCNLSTDDIVAELERRGWARISADKSGDIQLSSPKVNG